MSAPASFSLATALKDFSFQTPVRGKSDSFIYSKFVKKADETSEEVQKILAQNLPPSPKGFCITTTGSDARKEKCSSLSPIEFILITGSLEGALSPTKELETSLKKIGAQFPKMFDQNIQVQELGKNLLSYHRQSANGSVHLTIPNRAVEATLLYGDAEVMEKYKQETFNSLKSIKKHSRKHFYHQFCKPSLNELEDCFSKKSKKAVNLETRELYFDNQRIKSVKFPFLRPVQYTIMLYLIKAAKSDLLTERLFSEMPNPITERILWMQQKGMLPLSVEEAQTLSSAYDQMLVWFFQSQQAFRDNKQLTIDPKKLTETAEVIYRFATKKADENAL